MDRYIGNEEQVGICFDGPRNQVMQVSMGDFRRYWSLMGWELIGPAPQLFKDKVPVRVRQGQPTMFERTARAI